MSSPGARRGRTYASERYPWTYRSWAEETQTGGVIFGGESNPRYKRDMRMIARRRML
jgi:hypothetical protein